MAALPITFLSDYGYDDEFAGVCRAVIARIAPDAAVIDITHGIARHNVRAGALVLASALPFTPPGVHLAVVDPGVGTPRRAIALRVASDDRLLVGPDNGLLAPAVERLGGAIECVDLSASRFRLQPVSATFHGRDIFAPVAANLANGATLTEAGEPLDPESLAGLDLPRPDVTPEQILANVIHIDGFGNALLNVKHEDLAGGPIRLGDPVVVEVSGREHPGKYALTFADVPAGELIVYEDATQTLALAVNRDRRRGSAPRLSRLRGRASPHMKPNEASTVFGHPHLHYRLTDSTNERARELAAAGAPSGTVVTADEQGAGRGRRGRRWSAQAGKALLYSAILAPLTEAHLLLPLAVPLAVCEAIEAVSDNACAIKWPNDVWIEERKVAGVLIEARPPEWAVIGVGVNVGIEEGEFPGDLRWPAVSVGGGVPVETVATALSERLTAWVEAPAGEVLGEFRGRDALVGREVWWRDVAPREGDVADSEGADGAGTADGIDDRGNLVVVSASGKRRSLGAGQVQLSLPDRRD